MKTLIDTHAFLWWITDDPRLSKEARKVITNPKNEIFFSAASGWEIAIKSNLGRIELPQKPSIFIPKQITENSFTALAITLQHTLNVHDLPAHHRDPFDRILVAQSQTEKIPILTKDPLIAKYKVDVIW